MPPAEEAFEATGFVRGTITPLGSSTAWPVVADVVLASRGEITLGSGSHEVAIAVQALPLLEATGMHVGEDFALALEAAPEATIALY